MKFYHLVPLSARGLQWILPSFFFSFFPQSLTVAQHDGKNEQLAGR